MTQYINLLDYLRIAAGVVGVGPDVLVEDSDLDAIRGALNACSAHYELAEVHPSLPEKMTVLAYRLVTRRPLPTHNLPVTYEVLREFAHRNGHAWSDPSGDDDGEEIGKLLRGLADDSVTQQEFTAWVGERIEEVG